MNAGDRGKTDAMTEGTSVFVSYARADRDRAQAIVEALDARGMTVWWDGLIAGGETFSSRIEDALEAADVVVVLWSATSVQSHWVRDEAARGRDRGCIVPVSVDGTGPPLGFRQIHYLDLSGWDGSSGAPELGQLFDAVARARSGNGTDLPLMENAAMAASLPLAATARTSRRRMLLGAGAGALLIGGGGLILWQSKLAKTQAENGVAVLSFRNLTGDPGQDYLAAGLSEELRVTLSLNPSLQVAARTSSDSLRDSDTTPEKIAQQLGVAHILDGSVRRVGDRLRVAVQLIDATKGFDAWSQVFERPANDLLTVQSEIATTVADALSAAINVALTPSERPGGTKNDAAFDAYLRGTELYIASTGEETDRRALAAFEEAISHDAGYGAAHAARSRTLTVVGSSYAQGRALQTYFDSALNAARRAIELAPELAEGHAALGLAMMNGRLDLAAAREPYRRSFELGFGNAAMLTGFAEFATNDGEFEDARKAINRARVLDPLNFRVLRSQAIVAFYSRDYAGAREAALRSLALNDAATGLHRILGDMALVDGRPEEARREFQAEPSQLSALRGLAITDADLIDLPAGQRQFDALVRKYGDNSLYQQAQVLAQWGQTEQAIAALQRALSAGDPGLVLARNDPLLDPVGHDPRFKAILARLGSLTPDNEG